MSDHIERAPGPDTADPAHQFRDGGDLYEVMVSWAAHPVRYLHGGGTDGGDFFATLAMLASKALLAVADH